MQTGHSLAEPLFGVAGVRSDGEDRAEKAERGRPGSGVWGQPYRREAGPEGSTRRVPTARTPSKSNGDNSLKNGPEGPTAETEAHDRSRWRSKPGGGAGGMGAVGLTRGAGTPAT